MLKKDRELLLNGNKRFSRHVKFNGVFLKLINVYIVTESLVFIILNTDPGKYRSWSLIKYTQGKISESNHGGNVWVFPSISHDTEKYNRVRGMGKP